MRRMPWLPYRKQTRRQRSRLEGYRPMKLLTVRQVAERLGVHYSTALQWIAEGRIASVRLAGRRTIQVLEETVDRFIQDSAAAGNCVSGTSVGPAGTHST